MRDAHDDLEQMIRRLARSFMTPDEALHGLFDSVRQAARSNTIVNPPPGLGEAVTEWEAHDDRYARAAVIRPLRGMESCGDTRQPSRFRLRVVVGVTLVVVHWLTYRL